MIWAGLAVDLNGPAGLLVALFTLAGLLGAARPYIRAAATKATLELQEKELVVEREARKAQGDRHLDEVRSLRGEIDSLRIEYARAIADKVADRVVELVREEILGRR